jgi:hypothetical protein
MKWERSASPERGGVLGLLDPDPTGALPQGATVVDVLAWALCLPGSDDIVTGIVDGVSLELAVLTGVVPDHRVAQVMTMLGRRLDAASLLLKWADNRTKMPSENDDEETKDAARDDEEGSDA